MTRDTSRRGVPLLLVLVLAALAAAFPWILAALPRSSRYDTEVCRHCAVERNVSRRTLAGVSRRERVTMEETAVSRALDLAGACDHTWYPVRFDAASGSRLRRGETAHGGTRFRIINLLLIDDSFAEELADMPDPQQVWFDLLSAAEASPERVDAMVSSWWEGQPERQPFADWWEENKDALREP